jgi:hypothetical protein
MNAYLRRLGAVGLALLVLSHCIPSAAQTPVPKRGKVSTDYGLEPDMRIPSEVIRRTMIEIPPGTRVPNPGRNPLLLGKAGDVRYEVPPSSPVGASGVTLEGSPQLRFIVPKHPTDHILPASSALMTENIYRLGLVDQGACDDLMKTNRVGGLFRYVKRESPPLLKLFFRSLLR